MKARKWLILTLIVGLLPLISGCFEIVQIFQGLLVVPGGNVSVTVKVKTDQTDANPHYGIVGILIPNDWTINSVRYDGDFGPDECTLLPPGSPDKEPGLQDYWTDTLEVKYPSGSNMKWVVFQANTAYPSTVEVGNVNVHIQMTAGMTEGEYELGYFVSNTALDFTDPTFYSMKKAKIKVKPEAMHLLLSEVIVTPTESEYIEIFNPTAQDIDLSNYYITDATYVADGTFYYNIVTGSKYGGGSFSDFHARFPEGAIIMPGEYQTVALEGDAKFFSKLKMLPTYEIADDGAAGPDVPDMREAMPGSVNNLQGGLTNTSEIVVLYYWDGISDLVQDIDYFLYNDKGQVPTEAVDKTDVKIDGPDADTETSTYKTDTPKANQKFCISPKADEAAQRFDFFEGTEAKANGNGIVMHDETSENLNETWLIAAPTPNAPYLVITAINVTFQCNMDVQIKSGTFDPTKDKLVVRGSFNGWAGNLHELKDLDGDKIYTLTIELGTELIGQTIEYKYVMLPSGRSDVWESIANNRKFTLADKDMVLEVVYFSDQTVLLVKATVTFQADMSDLLDKGWFDPATDSIRIVGGMNGWANSESMEPDPFDPSLYLYDALVTAAVGDKVEWKFRGYPNNRFLDGGWEAGSNHVFEFTGTDLILDPLKPNILPGGKPIAQDVTVRFTVDVKGAVDWYNKKPFADVQSVWMNSDWNNWAGSWGVADTSVLIRLYDDGLTKGDAVAGDGIWTTEVLFTAGTMSSKLYKYSIYGAGVDTLNKGTSPMDNEAGFSVNHVMLIDDTNPLMVLPLDYFGSQWREKPVDNLVTFQCNMGIQIQSGSFDPAKDMVVVRGQFNGWAGNDDKLTDDDGDKIYTLTKKLGDDLVGQKLEYKFVIVPGTGGDRWESVGNRSFTLLAGGQILEVVYFDNQSVLSVTATVTFKADMSDLLDKGWFDPATDSIRVVGGMNGWANTESMEPDPFDPSLYLWDGSITAAPGATIEWKFRAYPNNKFLDSGWEMGNNSRFVFSGAAQELPARKPNISPAGKPLAQDVTVRFSVDVKGALDWYNKKPFADVKSVWLNSDWNNWAGSWGVADTTVLIRLYDNGSNGDAVAGDGIWTVDINFKAGEMSAKLYKYSIYGTGVDTLNKGQSPMDNEAGFSMNHALLIDDSSPLYVLPTDKFGSQWNTAVERIATTTIPEDFVLRQNYPNPFNPTTEIVYSLPKDVVVTLNIYNTLGHKIATLVNEKQAAGVYRIVWYGQDDLGHSMATGVYFYHLRAGDFSQTMKMLFVK